jgi:hypothetical protein
VPNFRLMRRTFSLFLSIMVASVNPGMACESATVASPLTARSKEPVTEEILNTILNSCRSLAQKKEAEVVARELGAISVDFGNSDIQIQPFQPFLKEATVSREQPSSDAPSPSGARPAKTIHLDFQENVALDIDAWRNQFEEAKPPPILHPLPWKVLPFHFPLPGPSGLDKCVIVVNYREGEQGIKDATLLFLSIHANIWE